MATTLTLTNGTTTIQLNNGSPWSLESDGIGFVWRPAINPWLPNDLAGGGDYGPAEETISIIGNAATHVSIRQSLQSLISVAQRIGSAYDGDVAEALLWRLQWTPEGSAVVYESVVTNGAVDVIEHPVTATGGVLTRIVLRLVRRGRWLEPQPTTSSGTANRRTGNIGAGILTTPTAFTGATGEHPGYLEIARPDEGSSRIDVTASGYLLIAVEADAGNRTSLQHLPWGTAPGGAWSDIADAATNYRATPVRYTPAGTAWIAGPRVTVTPQFRTRTIDIYLNARNNSTTTTFFARVQAFPIDVLVLTVYSDTIVIPPAASPVTTLHYLGRITLPELRPYVAADTTISLELQIQASAASGTIDFDDVVIVNPDAAGTNILRIVDPPMVAMIKAGSNYWGVWEHEELRNKRTPSAGLFSPMGVLSAEYGALRPHTSWSYYGRASLLIAQAPSMLLYGASAGTNWSRNTGNVLTYRLMRRIGYATPE